MIGAGIVFVLSAFVIPSPPANAGPSCCSRSASRSTSCSRSPAGTVWGTAGALRSLRWATRDDTDPTEQQRLEALGVPWFLTKVQATLWFAATALFTAFEANLQPDRALPRRSPSGSPRWW